MTFPSNSERGYHIIWNPVISSCHPFFEWQKWAMKKLPPMRHPAKKNKRPTRLPHVSQPVVHQRAEVQLQATALDEVAELGNGILAEAGVLMSVEYDIYIYIHRFI